jgi:predicted N-acetyltransferase YhbS
MATTRFGGYTQGIIMKIRKEIDSDIEKIWKVNAEAFETEAYH